MRACMSMCVALVLVLLPMAGLAYLVLLRRGPLIAWGLSVGLNLASVVSGVWLFRAL